MCVRCLIIFTVLLLGWPDTLHAQDASFTKEARPTITRATDVIAKPPSSVVVRSTLRFTPRDTAPARALAAKGFHIRVFTLSRQWDTPRAVTQHGDCDIYLSMVMPVRAQADGTIRIAELNEAWLELSYSCETPREGRFLFVFEETGPTDAIFRLRSEDAKSYFEQGFILTVQPDKQVDLVEAKRWFSRGEEQRGKLYLDANRVREGVPCYSYKSRKVVAENAIDLTAGDLLACEMPDATATPAS